MNIDATEYPIVWMDYEPARGASVEAALADISALLVRGQPLVFLATGEPGNGNDKAGAEDRRTVALWMKSNKHAIRRFALGHVQIVPESTKRVAMRAFAVVFAKFWGYPMFVVASEEEARAKADALLANV
ncbi:hypothetical protein [Aeromonas intestinalis]